MDIFLLEGKAVTCLILVAIIVYLQDIKYCQAAAVQ